MVDWQTVGQFLQGWLTDSVRFTVRPRTYRSYEELVRLHMEPQVGNIPLAKLSPQDVQKLINRKLEQGLSPRRVQYIHAVLRRALGQAEKWGILARNVARLVDAPRVNQPEINPFTPDEARDFIRAIQGDRLEALFHLALASGLRQGELLGLKWIDLDLENHQLFVRASLQRLDGKFQLVELKTARSRRTVALPESVIAVLSAHRLRQLKEKYLLGPY